MFTRLCVVLVAWWDKLRNRLGEDAGTVSNETAWVTGLLIAGGAIIVGILIAWGVDAANSIGGGGPAPPPQP